MTIGQRIKKAREKKKLTTSELAEKWGKSQASITEIEKDRSTKQYEKLGELCDLLDVSADYILGRKTKQESYEEQWEKLKKICEIIDIPLEKIIDEKIKEKESGRKHLSNEV